MKITVAILLVVIITDCHISKHFCNGKIIRCTSEDDNDSVNVVNEHCLDGDTMDTNFECHSLNALLSVRNDTIVYFCSAVFELHVHLVLQDVHNINFIGYPSLFTCNSSDTGLTVLNSENITINNITLVDCGVLHHSTSVDTTNRSSTITFQSAMYVYQSTTIKLESLSINYTDGAGLTLFDIDGILEVTDCTFAHNRISMNNTNVYPGGGGVYLEFTYCPPGQHGDKCDRHTNITNSQYNFNRCKFIHNAATNVHRKETDFAIDEGSNFQGLGRGGGLNVMFRGTASHNVVTLTKCSFVSNSAIWGGGLKVTFLDAVFNNSFTALECMFENNECVSYAGGGVDVGFSYFSEPFPRANKIEFLNCHFANNTAKFGGGVAFYSSSGSREDLNNIIEFDSCVWTHNKAQFGSAIDINTHAWATTKGYLPSPQFRNSVFLENSVIHKTHDHPMFSFYKKGNGAFLSTEFTINFIGKLNFTNNNGSALYLISSVAVFQPVSTVIFHNNNGFNGGAISLIGFSTLSLNDDVSITLSNNIATRCGGAIYSYSIDKHDFVSSRSCFIHTADVYKESNHRENTSVTFINNSAGMMGLNNDSMYCGHSIYATTLLPCHYACRNNIANDQVSVNDTFSCFGKFTFLNGSRDYELTTSGANFTLANTNDNIVAPIRIIPSKRDSLPVKLIDDLGQCVNAEVFVNVTNNNNNKNDVTVARSYGFLLDKEMIIYGQAHDIAYVTVSKTTLRENAFTFEVEVQDCPPGFVNINNQCICSAGTEHFYSPVFSCDLNKFVARARHGYWIGYIGGNSEDDLMYSYCPSRSCFLHVQHNRSHLLIERASRDELDRLICGNESTGILCGTCRDGYSVNYHSRDGLCTNESCKFGWLLYVVSELFPLTLLFIVVIVFNISFVTGELSGFIFFSQMFDSLSISAQGFIWFPKTPYQAIRIARLFYKLFNFDFFTQNELSFYLWRGATMLDMLAFKYITMAYASLLIVTTIWLISKCNLYNKIYCLRASTMRASITHGLSTFLVMVYAQSATVSLKILDYTPIHSKGHRYNRSVVTYQGDISYFHPHHLPYAIPALICVFTIVIPPALVLICYPSCLKLVAFFHLGENKCLSWLLQKIPHALLKPFADTFQSSFKDNLRFFAGLYFVYRLFILVSVVLPSLLTQQFMLLELCFVLMLLMHALFQPYKAKLHNIIDALIFFNLAVINGITVYNYHYTKLDFAEKIGVNTLINIQVFLAYLPMVYFTLYTLVCLIYKVRGYSKLENSRLGIQLKEFMQYSGSHEELPSRLRSNEEIIESDDDYQLYNEQTMVADTY